MQAQTVCFSFYALFLSSTSTYYYFVFLNIVSSPKRVLSLNHLYSSSLFLCPQPQTSLNLVFSLSVFFLLSFCNPAGNHMNTLNSTSSCSHLEVSAVPGASSLGWILHYSRQFCVMYLPSLSVSSYIFWPHLFLVPAGNLGVWKWNSSTAGLVPARQWTNGCSETLWHCG